MRARRPAAVAVAAVLAGLLAALTLAAPATPTAFAAAPHQRLTLPLMEQDFMCVVCHEALDVAQAPEADQERQEISRLLAQGDTRAQIDREMVVQYGSAVLAVPKAKGFNILFYVLPPVLVAAALATLAVLLPRWRRRARAAAAAGATAPPPVLDHDAAERLDEELARYKG